MSQRFSLRNISASLLLGSVGAIHAAMGASEPSKTWDVESSTHLAARREVVAALFEWIAATNARDFDAQDAFYPARMDVFYLWRNTSHADVLAEKRRVFDAATTIEIKADAPQIIIEPGGKTARTYFRKTYTIDGTRRNRTGEVLQELRWEQQPEGWKIVSERDLRVIHQASR